MTKLKQVNIRLDEKTLKDLEEIRIKEANKTGYDISTSALITKTVRNFIKNYKG